MELSLLFASLETLLSFFDLKQLTSRILHYKYIYKSSNYCHHHIQTNPSIPSHKFGWLYIHIVSLFLTIIELISIKMPPTRNLVLVIFFALSLFSASCDGGSLLQTETTCRRRRHHHRHRCHHRKHHRHNHLKGRRKQPHQKVLSVDDFGAKGDGTTDDSEVYMFDGFLCNQKNQQSQKVHSFEQ